MLPKTAIIGATGFLGRAFLAAHREIHFDCIGADVGPCGQGIRFIDLFSPVSAPLKLAESGHKEALILAGIAGLAECDQDKERTRKVNVEGTLGLVKQLVNEGIKPVFFSSDVIFDGTTGLYDDGFIPGPVNEYARQKAEVEMRMKEICRDGNYLIVRLSKVFSLDKGGGTLFDEMAATLASGGPLRVADDQIFSPIFIRDVIDIVSILQVKNITGVININPPEAWSRYDLALTLAQYMQVSSDYIKKISLDDLQGGFKRPKNTTMKVDKMLRETGYSFKPTKYYIERIAKNWQKEVDSQKEKEVF